jgi:5-hydroxyisourate hydrolase-like protein (transthyretin family)
MNDTNFNGDKDIASENDNIKDSTCNISNCTFEISEDNKSDESSQKAKGNFLNDGEIVVVSILECEEHEYLKGVKINLYKINGLSPILLKTQTTDEKGKATFSGIEEGCYRIIEIIDKRYFEKPKYINWNEIIIDKENKNQKIIILNRIKKNVSQSKAH